MVLRIDVMRSVCLPPRKGGRRAKVSRQRPPILRRSSDEPRSRQSPAVAPGGRFARQSCARFFRDGGAPADALRAFGLAEDERMAHDWGKAVESIAEVLCAQPMKRAA